ncbi:jg13830 [Pararge aegeria aegeria]|uniref:Cytochrome c oxidase subunit 4 n=1 Tax=Pararge aegeria aegeria TaxID=348720 RepID=A0A8S4S9A8_9NEOP|nr:jg13830 [Pararge aegeria aegeria]
MAKVGNREWVGYGFNGQPNYMDRPDYPLPAVRFRPDTPDIKILREKEKGDWRKLTVEEKKALYRASFCQTFAEFQAPTGQWKGVIGWALVIASMSLWAYMGMKLFVYSPLPESSTPWMGYPRNGTTKTTAGSKLSLWCLAVEGLASGRIGNVI